jgi:hypothetical protein
VIYLIDGVRVHPEAGFTRAGVQYPPGWLKSAGPEVLSELGVTTRNDESRPNPRWYDSSQNQDGSWNPRQRDLSAMADAMKAQIKQTARNKILTVCPEWRQTNLVARGVEVLLDMILNNIAPGDLSAPTQAEIAAGLEVWLQIRALRVRSGEIEVLIDATIAREDIGYADKVAILEGILEPDSAEWTL